MKKPYQKPRVYAESFELLEHIASCKANQDITSVTYRDGKACSYTDANVTLFNPDYAPIQITEDSDFRIYGRVIS